MFTFARKPLWWLPVGAVIVSLATLALASDGKDSPTNPDQPQPPATPSPRIPPAPRPITPKPVASFPIPTTPHASQVRAYAYNRVQYQNRPFLQMPSAGSEYRFSPDRLPAEGRPLLPNQVDQYPALLGKLRYLPDSAEPFRPGHALVFYTKTGQVQRVLEISLGQMRAQEFRVAEFQRREVALKFSDVANMLYKVKLPLSADGNTNREFNDSRAPAPLKEP